MASLLLQAAGLGSLFGSVAARDPISAILLALGAILTLGAIVVLGYLALGAAVRLVAPDRVGRVHRPGA